MLVGCLLNRDAAAKAMLALATEHGRDATVVCAAETTSVSLEDTLGAGAIAEAALRLDASLQPTDAAVLARDAFLARRGDLRAALASARHGAELLAAGFSADVAFCARLDTCRMVPSLARDEEGRLALKPLP